MITRFVRQDASGWEIGMHVVDLGAGELLIYSPTWLGEGTFERIEALGRARVLVAPNHFHHLSLARFRARYPEALALAHPRALGRLEKKGHRGLEPADRAALPSSVELVECPGTKTGELWLTVRDGAAQSWVVGDAFFNVCRPVGGVVGWLVRATRTTPGLCIGQTFRWLALDDEPGYRRWLLERLEDPPSHMHFCHGEPLEVDAAALVELARSRLR